MERGACRQGCLGAEGGSLPGSPPLPPPLALCEGWTVGHCCDTEVPSQQSTDEGLFLLEQNMQFNCTPLLPTAHPRHLLVSGPRLGSHVVVTPGCSARSSL